MEIIKFIFSDFLHWFGALLMLAIVCEAAVRIFAAVFRVPAFPRRDSDDEE